MKSSKVISNSKPDVFLEFFFWTFFEMHIFLPHGISKLQTAPIKIAANLGNPICAPWKLLPW